MELFHTCFCIPVSVACTEFARKLEINVERSIVCSVNLL